MEILYFDFSESSEAIGIIKENALVLPAGASVYAMPLKDKNGAYKRIETDCDVHFIFEDNVPEIDFYAVPFINIFAHDSSAGMLASVGGIADFESDQKIIYISSDRSIYLAADNGQEFLKNIAFWKENLKPFLSVELFPDINKAKERYSFIDLK